jgi:hypothetical protein
MAQELHIAFGPFRLEPLSGHLWRSDDGIALRPRSLVGRRTTFPACFLLCDVIC